MLERAGGADQSLTQAAIREALDHALDHGDDVTAHDLALILRAMVLNDFSRLPSGSGNRGRPRSYQPRF